MGNNSILKIAVVILIPILVYLGKGYWQEFLSANEAMVVDLTPMDNIDKVMGETNEGVDILKNFDAQNVNYNIFNGVDATKLSRYFSGKKIQEAEAAKEDNATKAKAIAAPRKPAVKAPVYKIDFVFVGADDKYISMGNTLLEIGDKTPSGEVIKNIEANRIQLQGKWGLRWVPVNY